MAVSPRWIWGTHSQVLLSAQMSQLFGITSAWAGKTGRGYRGFGPWDREGSAFRNTNKSCQWMPLEKGCSCGYGEC